MKTCSRLFLGCLFVTASLTTASADTFSFRPLSTPRPFVEKGKVNLVIEASAVEPIDERHALTAHDKAAPLHVFDLKTGELSPKPVASPRFPATTKTGPKWEGMTRDAAGNFYVIGSHSGKTDEERAEKSDLVRFRLNSDNTVDDASVTVWKVAPSLERAVKKTSGEATLVKRKVEGLSYRKHAGRDELLIGLREPGDLVRVYRADITDAPAKGGTLEFSELLFAFKADDREGNQSQLTSLQHVPELGGCLVTTASEDDANVFHGNTLWFVADGETSKAVKISVFEVAMKVEGIAVLKTSKADDKTVHIDLLMTYDNDPHATKIPSRFQTARLTRKKS